MTVKEQARQVVETLPDDATWEQVRYELHVREQIDAGEAAIAEGRTVPHEFMRHRAGAS